MKQTDIDAATLKACQRGDEAAFRRLVEAHQRPVHSLCVALAGSAEGEDLAQETFLRVYQAIARFDTSRPTALRSWILTIARRLCVDRARHLSLRVEIAPATPADAPDPAPGPEEQVAATRLEARLQLAFRALPEEHRVVIGLYEWEGLDYEEIAAIEGVPVGTVRSRLSRARATLRAALTDRDVEEENHRALGR